MQNCGWRSKARRTRTLDAFPLQSGNAVRNQVNFFLLLWIIESPLFLFCVCVLLLEKQLCGTLLGVSHPLAGLFEKWLLIISPLSLKVIRIKLHRIYLAIRPCRLHLFSVGLIRSCE